MIVNLTVIIHLAKLIITIIIIGIVIIILIIIIAIIRKTASMITAML